MAYYKSLVKGMNYQKGPGHTGLLWASLATQQPRRLPDTGRSIKYTMLLQRQALIDKRFPPTTGGSCLSYGHYLGLTSLRLSNYAGALVYRDPRHVAMQCSEDRPYPNCNMTIAVEELLLATPPEDAHPFTLDPFRLNSLACVYEWLGRLLEA